MIVGVGEITADCRGDDLPRSERRAVVDGDDRERVGRSFRRDDSRVMVGNRCHGRSLADNDRLEAGGGTELGQPAAERFLLGTGLHDFQREDGVLTDHREQRRVDRIDTLAEDRPLASLLAGDPAGGGVSGGLEAEKAAGILEVVAVDDPCERLAGGKGLTVAGKDVADLPLRDAHQWRGVDGVLPAPPAEVEATAEDVGLVTGLGSGSDDPPLRHAASKGPPLLHDADPVVGDPAEAEPKQHGPGDQDPHR